MSWDLLIILNITSPRPRRKKRAACLQKTKFIEESDSQLGSTDEKILYWYLSARNALLAPIRIEPYVIRMRPISLLLQSLPINGPMLKQVWCRKCMTDG